MRVRYDRPPALAKAERVGYGALIGVGGALLALARRARLLDRLEARAAGADLERVIEHRDQARRP